MAIDRRALLATGTAAALGGLPRASRAQTAPIRIGVLTDMSGPYRDLTGPSSLAGAKQAAEEFSAATGIAVEVIAGDHQNKPDLGVNIARQWFDRDGIDMIADLPNSAVALAVSQVAREKNKVVVGSSVGSTAFSGAQCSPNSVQFTYDTYMLAKGTGDALVKQGFDSWYFVTADYAFGHALQTDTARFVEAAGGKVLGAARYPFPATTDFSSFLLQAQATRPKVIGFANAGADLVNCIKQAREFGLANQGVKFACLLMTVMDTLSLGLPEAQGLLMTDSFYWDLNPRTRAFSERVKGKLPGRITNTAVAGNYGGTLHYLKAVQSLGVAQARASGLAVVERMKAMPTDDDAFGPGRIRQDGRKLTPAYLFQVKTPAESTGPLDLHKVIATTPAEQAARPLAEGGCPFIQT
ncbi:ABC transporter substrate-binding protein [Paracraurococcus lichenis]|uniref:ABC transporter substrate-binding protein n=1 Tax=Paracraurococcus lichenis TaxID=3064888 RepID=A0ABT9DSK2_9PROT|nr:ABC transporter substrate-binding protein [Paracraurococcus sp. LOR1-02]MDO9706874.1 ABC transporter substrate-binding protein [Paracraurococcus sp. LOR1-02]